MSLNGLINRSLNATTIKSSVRVTDRKREVAIPVIRGVDKKCGRQNNPKHGTTSHNNPAYDVYIFSLL